MSFQQVCKYIVFGSPGLECLSAELVIRFHSYWVVFFFKPCLQRLEGSKEFYQHYSPMSIRINSLSMEYKLNCFHGVGSNLTK